MSTEHEPFGSSQDKAVEGVDSKDNSIQTPTRSSRRKFIKGVAVTTPVILTVLNRPVWAKNCSLSGQLSGNLSDHDGLPCSGEGCSTTFWMQNANLTYYHQQFQPYMLFYEAFGRDVFPGKTLLDVVQGNIANNEISMLSGCLPTADCRKALLTLGAEAVAALQNSATPVRYELEVDSVIMSFRNSYDSGTVLALQDTAAAFAKFNNQICPLPYSL